MDMVISATPSRNMPNPPGKDTVWLRKWSLVNKHIRNPNRNKRNGAFVTVHHHHGGPGLHELEASINELKAYSEGQGCPFKVVTVVRDPLDHAISTYYFTHKKKKWYTDENIEKVLGDFTAVDNGQIRYAINNHRHLRPAYPMGGVGSLTNTHLCEAVRLMDSVVDEVFFLSDLDGHMNRLQEQFSLPTSQKRKANKNKRRDAVPPRKLVDGLVARGALDRELYDYLVRKNSSSTGVAEWPAACAAISPSPGRPYG
jgi:hypothetical protein